MFTESNILQPYEKGNECLIVDFHKAKNENDYVIVNFHANVENPKEVCDILDNERLLRRITVKSFEKQLHHSFEIVQYDYFLIWRETLCLYVKMPNSYFFKIVNESKSNLKLDIKIAHNMYNAKKHFCSIYLLL